MEGSLWELLISFGQAVSEEKPFQKSNNKKQELPMTAMFVNGSKRNEQYLVGAPIGYGSFLRAE
jgi:hypothetical protein